MFIFISNFQTFKLSKTKMPFLLNLETRNVSKVYTWMELGWYFIKIGIKRAIHGGLGLEYNPAHIQAIISSDETKIIVQSSDDAYDIEYWTREANTITCTPGGPHPITFYK